MLYSMYKIYFTKEPLHLTMTCVIEEDRKSDIFADADNRPGIQKQNEYPVPSFKKNVKDGGKEKGGGGEEKGEVGTSLLCSVPKGA